MSSMVHIKKKFKTTPYKRGYNFENRVRKFLESQGWYVIRQGKSAFPDLICIEKATEVDPLAVGVGYSKINVPYSRVRFIECKVDGYISPGERAELVNLVAVTGGMGFVASRVRRRGFNIDFKLVEAKV